jgi:uncharacterized protein YhaN
VLLLISGYLRAESCL